MTQLVVVNKEIKSHIMKLTNALAFQKQGKAISQCLSNPKGHHQVAETSKPSAHIIKEVNAITTVIDTLVDKEDKLKISIQASSKFLILVRQASSLQHMKTHKIRSSSFDNWASKSLHP